VDEGAALLNAIQSSRRTGGQDPLPRVEQLEALDVSEQRLRVLEDIRALMMEQNRLLARLAGEDLQGSALDRTEAE
jgi:hypothetical protein